MVNGEDGVCTRWELPWEQWTREGELRPGSQGEADWVIRRREETGGLGSSCTYSEWEVWVPWFPRAGTSASELSFQGVWI